MATTPQVRPGPAGAGDAQGQSQDQGGDDPNMAKWRKYAELGQQLAQEFPETTDPMMKIFEQIKIAMTKVSANPQRTAPKQAPPNG